MLANESTSEVEPREICSWELVVGSQFSNPAVLYGVIDGYLNGYLWLCDVMCNLQLQSNNQL